MKKYLPAILGLSLLVPAIAATPKNDAEITNMLMPANTEEMNLAKLAQKNAESKQVKDFAQMMMTEHAKNNDKAQALAQKKKIALKESKGSEAMQYASQEKFEKLKTLKGKEFDREYMTTQVGMHKKVLNDLDTNLIPNAKTPELKTMLQDTRKKVEGHMKKAEEISGTL